MKTILFLGNHHQPNDPRLCYRQMKILSEAVPDIKFIFLKVLSKVGGAALGIRREKRVYGEVSMDYIEIDLPYSASTGVCGVIARRFQHTLHMLRLRIIMLEAIGDTRVDVVQASDVWEIRLALKLAKLFGARLIYDSHEDYVRQILDYNDLSLRSVYNALRVWLIELLCVNSFEAVFCTDDYLYARYKKWWYRQGNVQLLRNYPLGYAAVSRRRNVYSRQLKLVYIGGVTPQRGIIQCAEYTKRFNSRYADKSLNFTVIGTYHKLLDAYVSEPWFSYAPWVDYPELMAKLAHYDVGVCLWQNIKKFHRNLPLKNFDYMAAGLPLLTSDFGLLNRYLVQAQSGIGIDPDNYAQFETAILRLFDPALREQFSRQGMRWVREKANFAVESKGYCSVILGRAYS